MPVWTTAVAAGLTVGWGLVAEGAAAVGLAVCVQHDCEQVDGHVL